MDIFWFYVMLIITVLITVFAVTTFNKVEGVEKRLLTKLKGIDQEDPNTLNYGICYLVGRKDLEESELLKRGFMMWPKFSGLTYTPIKSPNWGASPIDQFMQVSANDFNVGSRKEFGEYLELRKDLINFLIEQIEKGNLKHEGVKF